ncbi:Hypothetical protein NTJ_15623 [Nesidiocoris tenuis]|uniref:Uncharacterized protein n=1 Tax=Nesidiocoris tenuis TaxID=355587 RepID=A0ABN7BEK6_9HEMI|nr:Hypothetical protein NTJ_15623 [Nesidiocoris tenuis]
MRAHCSQICQLRRGDAEMYRRTLMGSKSFGDVRSHGRFIFLVALYYVLLGDALSKLPESFGLIDYLKFPIVPEPLKSKIEVSGFKTCK